MEKEDMQDIRRINTEKIAIAVKELIYRASFTLAPGVEDKFQAMMEAEDNPLSRETLEVLRENALIARSENLALCQDCGTAIIFLEIGQKVLLEGEDLDKAINGSVESAYREYFLRKSIVADPLRRGKHRNEYTLIHTYAYYSGQQRQGHCLPQGRRL